jgi:hypothetical protein
VWGKFSVFPSFPNNTDLFSMKPQGMLHQKSRFCLPHSGCVKDK